MVIYLAYILLELESSRVQRDSWLAYSRVRSTTMLYVVADSGCLRPSF